MLIAAGKLADMNLANMERVDIALALLRDMSEEEVSEFNRRYTPEVHDKRPVGWHKENKA